ncbi:hypothetical protein AVEN_140626-1 [Araneus ventricosus]|uniref:DUF5641 domain-containing protein n=1 Tax=Araneus ventricosus TaxID=182803 RepID=A0A4Y2VA16_ARAVE|nr:hypothetical protein AVEN_140626-1 [Araneus ventricosus]
MIGTVKSCLCKCAGKYCLEEESLSTVLIGIEVAFNSSPIVYNNGMDDEVEALTPAHFIIRQKLTTISTSAEAKSVALTELWKKQQVLLYLFWRRLSKEYLLNLRNYHEVRNTNKLPKIREGDVVLLEEEHRPRQVWKQAIVLKLIPCHDGIERTYHLSCDEKIIAPPIQLAIPLEIDQDEENVEK